MNLASSSFEFESVKSSLLNFIYGIRCTNNHNNSALNIFVMTLNLTIIFFLVPSF